VDSPSRRDRGCGPDAAQVEPGRSGIRGHCAPSFAHVPLSVCEVGIEYGTNEYISCQDLCSETVDFLTFSDFWRPQAKILRSEAPGQGRRSKERTLHGRGRRDAIDQSVCRSKSTRWDTPRKLDEWNETALNISTQSDQPSSARWADKAKGESIVNLRRKGYVEFDARWAQVNRRPDLI
jgi:hypothetical protein